MRSSRHLALVIRGRRPAGLAAACLGLLFAGWLGGPAAQSAAPSGAPRTSAWVHVPSPNAGVENNLQSVAGHAAGDVTAVGSYVDAGSRHLTLIEHWNGTAWAIESSPNPSPSINALSSVASDQAGGYWAAGSAIIANAGALIEHQSAPGAPWTVAAVPALSGYPSLNGIAAVAPNNAWAVGSTSSGATLVLHWDGSTWAVVPSPSVPSALNLLTGVTAVDADNVWASGVAVQANGAPFTLHCDHTLTCTIVSFPPAGTDAWLEGITGLATGGGAVALWASGWDTDATGTHALVGYYDGTSWNLRSPDLTGKLYGIALAPSATGSPPLTDLFATGEDDSASPPAMTAVFSTDQGKTWTPIPPDRVGSGTNVLHGIGLVDPFGGVWAVGQVDNDSGHEDTVTERFSGVAPPPTPTPSPCAEPPPVEPSPAPKLVPNDSPYYHSTLIAYDPSEPLRGDAIDDETIAGMIQNLIAPGGVANARDAILLFQECYGGGMLDALDARLGSRVKWVGGAASTVYQPAIAVQGAINGGTWTSALTAADSPLEGGTVIDALQYAGTHDPYADRETGQYLTRDGGEGISLADPCALSHHAILWAGYAAPSYDPAGVGMSIYSDIARMRDTLVAEWGEPNGTTVTIDVLFGDGRFKPDGTPLPADWHAQPGTWLQLDIVFELLHGAMNPNEQFVFYASDHGGYLNHLISPPEPIPPAKGAAVPATPVPLPPGGVLSGTVTLHAGNVSGLLDYPPSVPAMVLTYTGHLDGAAAVTVAFNGRPIGALAPGAASVTLPVTRTLVGLDNVIRLQSSNATAITLTGETLASGPIGPVPPPVCTTSYTDVPPGSAFYSFVECLACGGLISGYADGTYRPGANVTRGQAAKILANAAKYADPIPDGQQTFEDVPPGAPFWLFVEEVAAHGAISGYACGAAPAGPCVPPANRPYFAPQNNMTRGQLAKVDAATAGFADPIPGGRQTFADVPATSPFYLPIERVALHGVISGYACGGPGEPCDAGQRAYFRPGNQVTRGQTAKIVSLSFFPACQAP